MWFKTLPFIRVDGSLMNAMIWENSCAYIPQNLNSTKLDWSKCIRDTGQVHIFGCYTRTRLFHVVKAFMIVAAVSNQRYKDSLNVFQLKVLLSSLHQQTATHFCQRSNYEAINCIFLNNSQHLTIIEICTAKIWQSSCKKWNIFSKFSVKKFDIFCT